jgi:hypothetical protein
MADKKEKMIKKINIVDVFVIIIIVAAIAFTYFKFNMSEHADVTSSNVKAEYTILINALRDFTIDEFSVGDKVYDNESGKYIGTIKDIKTEDSYDYITKNDGTVVYSKMPERYDVRLYMEADAVLNDKGIAVSGAKTLHNNQKIVVYTQKVQTEGQVLDVRTVE